MANEAQLLTVNAAGTSWVDVTPGAVSTGYQAQNTNIEAGRVGIDATHVTASGGDAILQISGPVDVSGVAYKITSAVTLTPGSDGTYYIKLVAGTGDNFTPTLSASKGAWDAARNGLYDSDERVLNWVVLRVGGVVTVSRYSRALTVDGAADIGGTLDVTGAADIGGTLDVTGAATFNGVVLPTTSVGFLSVAIGSFAVYTPTRGWYLSTSLNFGNLINSGGGAVSASDGASGGPYTGTSATGITNFNGGAATWTAAKF